PVKRWIVRMAVQDQFRAVTAGGALEAGNAEQPLVLRHRSPHWRMMDEDNPEQAPRACFFQCFGEPARLPLLEKAIGHERCGRPRRGDADQSDIPDYAKVGKGLPVDMTITAVATHPRRPRTADLVEGAGHISIVIAGDRKSTRLNSSHVKISYAVF